MCPCLCPADIEAPAGLSRGTAKAVHKALRREETQINNVHPLNTFTKTADSVITQEMKGRRCCNQISYLYEAGPLANINIPRDLYVLSIPCLLSKHTDTHTRAHTRTHAGTHTVNTVNRNM